MENLVALTFVLFLGWFGYISTVLVNEKKNKDKNLEKNDNNTWTICQRFV